MLGAESNCQENQQRSKAQKAPKKHSKCSPVRKFGVSGLMIISRRRRRLTNPITDMSRSLWSAVIPKSTAVNTGDREKSEKRLYSVVYVERKRNLWGSVTGLIALSTPLHMAHTPAERLGWKPNPPCRATAMSTRKPEKGEACSRTWSRHWC